MTRSTTEVRPRPEGGGVFAPALGGGSGAKRDASIPQVGLSNCLGASRSGTARDATRPGWECA